MRAADWVLKVAASVLVCFPGVEGHVDTTVYAREAELASSGGRVNRVPVQVVIDSDRSSTVAAAADEFVQRVHYYVVLVVHIEAASPTRRST